MALRPGPSEIIVPLLPIGDVGHYGYFIKIICHRRNRNISSKIKKEITFKICPF